MSWHVQRVAKRRDKLSRSQPQSRRRLRIEQLEGRALLSGVVDIQLAAGFLTLVGDGSNNQVELKQTNNAGEYFVSSPDNTLFQINGAGATLADATVNGISQNITVDLLDGNDSFSFLGVAPGTPSSTPDDLNIQNSDGSNVNVLSEVLVNGNLFVNKNAASSGYSELRIVNSTVIGDTVVNNVGNQTGDTKTLIDNSKLQGGGAQNWGLLLENPNGEDIFDALGSSQFGTGNFVGNPPVVRINNADGGSRTTFTGANQIAGPGTTTIYGQIEIDNSTNLPGTLDMVMFNSVNVLGAVTVQNGDGNTETVTLNSTLGSDFLSQQLIGTGGSFRVRNDAGFDTFEMTDSLVPWGLEIDNDLANRGQSNWGSDTQINSSTILTHPPGPGLMIPALPPGFPDVAFLFSGDDGADDVNLIETTMGGAFGAFLFDGNNNVTMLTSMMSGIGLFGGNGNDTVSIDNTQIVAYVLIVLDDGADTLSIHNVNYATQWPNPLLGFVEIYVDDGVDTFSGVVPPSDVFDGFDLFIP